MIVTCNDTILKHTFLLNSLNFEVLKQLKFDHLNIQRFLISLMCFISYFRGTNTMNYLLENIYFFFENVIAIFSYILQKFYSLVND